MHQIINGWSYQQMATGLISSYEEKLMSWSGIIEDTEIHIKVYFLQI